MTTYTRYLSLVLIFITCSSGWICAQQYDDYQLSTLIFVAKGESSISTADDVLEAQNALAIRYKEGTGGAQKNLGQSVYWFSRAAEGGYKWAQSNLAYAYLNGEGVAKDESKALYWFEKAGNQHLHRASLKAGKMNYYGQGATKNYSKAARYFKDAAFGGLEEGMYYYAECFAKGNGVPVDSVKALFWAERAIEKEYYWTYWLLGCMYRDGLSVAKDDWNAKYYFELGDKKNIHGCQNDLGVGYMKGSFVEKDQEKAMEYYTRAAENGSSVAMGNLASNYSNESSPFYNPDRAIFWYKKLINEGNEKYIKDIIYLYKKTDDYASAVKYYEILANKGSASAYNSLAYIFAQGQGNVNRNFQTAIDYIEAAIRIEPNNMTFQDSKGEILMMMGEIKKAAKVWKYINKTQPDFYSNWISENGHEPEFYRLMTK